MCKFFITETIYKIDALIDEYNSEMIVVLEDVSANSPVFGIDKTYEKTPGQHHTKLAACCKQAERIGSVKDKTELTAQFLDQQKIKTIRVKPSNKSATKLDQETFFNLTKIDKSQDGINALNEHSRDAAMLVFMRKK